MIWYQIMTSPQTVYLETCLTVSIHHKDETEVYVNFTCTQETWLDVQYLLEGPRCPGTCTRNISETYVLIDKIEQILCSIF